MEISDKNRIREYFNDPSTRDESFVAYKYLADENENELKEIAREHWEKAPSTEFELQHILDRVHFYINSRKAKPSTRSRILSVYYHIASILLIPLLIGGIYLFLQNSNRNNTYAEIRALEGSRVQFTLPDGSMGSLNGGSMLKYPTNFSENRIVSLIGEGYFEVIKDKEHPFTVQTKYADIQVFGTKFDVCAYEDDHDVFTTLEEGSVQVFNKTGKTYSMLDPGEQNVINKSNGKMRNTPVNTDLYTSWKDDMLKFNNSPFNEVVHKMERWYGVKIVLDKRLEYTENYTFTVKTESLKELLDLLSITTPMSYNIDKDIVMIYPLKQKAMKN
jgi:ferric-dicitrate binding protein FerR (iron transport regulator)